MKGTELQLPKLQVAVLDLRKVQALRGLAIGGAVGDALGAPHEFHPPLAADVPLTMSGGGAFNWAPGQWTDDTEMAEILLSVLHREAKSTWPFDETVTEVLHAWSTWALTARDVGALTSGVLADIRANNAWDAIPAAALAGRHAQHRNMLGNGSLMRAWPVAAYARTPEEAYDLGRLYSTLTHNDTITSTIVGTWTAMLHTTTQHGLERHQVATHIRRLVEKHTKDRRTTEHMMRMIERAERLAPGRFQNINGTSEGAFQTALSTVLRADSFEHGMELVVRVGSDTDTVASIAGAALGALHGGDTIRPDWVAACNSNGMTAETLAGKTVATATLRWR